METKKKTKTTTGPKPVHTVRRGAIAANIWQRQSQTGFIFFEYSLSRSWRSQSTEKEGYSSNFHTRNKAALTEVIAEASAWIEAQGDADSSTQEAA